MSSPSSILNKCSLKDGREMPFCYPVFNLSDHFHITVNGRFNVKNVKLLPNVHYYLHLMLTLTLIYL